MSLTGIYDTDLEILSRLPLEDLIYVCQTNSYFNKMCDDDNLWRMRVLFEFGPVESYKPAKISYYDLLEFDANVAAANGRVDALIVNAQKESWPEEEAIERAAGEGHVVALEWLKRYNLIPNNWGLDNAASEGHLETLQLYPQLMTSDIANTAASYGHLNILKWLSTLNIRPTLKGLDLAAANGHTNVLQWATECMDITIL